MVTAGLGQTKWNRWQSFLLNAVTWLTNKFRNIVSACIFMRALFINILSWLVLTGCVICKYVATERDQFCFTAAEVHQGLWKLNRKIAKTVAVNRFTLPPFTISNSDFHWQPRLGIEQERQQYSSQERQARWLALSVNAQYKSIWITRPHWAEQQKYVDQEVVQLCHDSVVAWAL